MEEKEKITATIRNENDEREEVEVIVDDVELTPEKNNGYIFKIMWYYSTSKHS